MSTDRTDMELLNAVAWAKTCLLIAAATKPGSPERVTELTRLKKAIVEPRRLVDAIFASGGEVSPHLLVALRTCEKAVPELERGALPRC